MHYHADNGIFNAEKWRESCRQQRQGLTFAGVNAHHQNGVAERNISTIIECERTLILHSYIHCSNKINMELWTFSVRYSVDLWNNTPHVELEIKTPNELFSNINIVLIHSEHVKRYNRLPHFNTFGCPVYVLHNDLQGTNATAFSINGKGVQREGSTSENHHNTHPPLPLFSSLKQSSHHHNFTSLWTTRSEWYVKTRKGTPCGWLSVDSSDA